MKGKCENALPKQEILVNSNRETGSDIFVITTKF